MKDDYFVMASECHLLHSLRDINYYPKFRRYMAATDRFVKILLGPDCTYKDLPRKCEAVNLIQDMNDAGIDVGCALRESMMDASDQATSWGTNGWVLQQIEPFPDRLVLEANVGPILRRGVKAAIWEMEYLVKERNAKLIKVYQCEDIGPLNDPAMWPFYEKAVELGVPLTIHVGQAWVPFQYSDYVRPSLLDKVLVDFPELKVIAYHMGWPYCDELFAMALKFDNLYVGLSAIIGWFTWAPYHGYNLIGKAIQCCGTERLVFGLDWPGVKAKPCVDYIKNFDMPDELVEKWGFKKLTEQDKRMILGETLAKLAGVEVRKRI